MQFDEHIYTSSIFYHLTMTFSIRTNLLPIKAHFFLFFGGISPVCLFMTTFAKQLGFSAVLVGSIFTILPLLGMAVKLLMGTFADRFQCHKLLIIIYLITSTICSLSLDFITPINKKIEADLLCKNNSIVRICSEGTLEKCFESKIISEYKDNIPINCKLECIVDNQFMKSGCKLWNASNYCETSDNENLKSQIVDLKRAEANYDADESINRTSYNSSIIQHPTKKTIHILRFNTHLLSHHVKQDGSCLFIQIGGTNDVGNLYTPNCKTQKEFPCQMVCDNPTLTDNGKVVNEETALNHSQFWLFIIISAVYFIGIGTINCLGETVCFGLLGDQPGKFGRQRLWGSLGWGVMSLVGGALVDKFSGNKAIKNYSPIFYTSAVLIGLDVIAASQIKNSRSVKSASIIWDVGKLFKNVRVIIYIVWCVCMGMSNGLIMNFFFWHLEDLSNCNGLEKIKTLEGLYVTLQAFCGEFPSFFLNGWVLKKIGHIHSMSLTLFAFGAIFILFSVLDNPIYFLPISILNGITFSTMYATMTSYASIIAPPGTEATMQGLVGSVYEGLGISFGSFIAGLLMHYLKGAKVFLLYGIVALVICMLHICTQVFLLKSNNIQVTSKKDEMESVQYTSPENAVKMLNENNC